jgi:DNA-directed RNA polymerase specialized sigma54-like protein
MGLFQSAIRAVQKGLSGGLGKQTTVVFSDTNPNNDTGKLNFNTLEEQIAANEKRNPSAPPDAIQAKKPKQKWFPVIDYVGDQQAFNAVKGADEAAKRQSMREKVLQEYGLEKYTLNNKLISQLNNTQTEAEVRHLADRIITELEGKLAENIRDKKIRNQLPRAWRW